MSDSVGGEKTYYIFANDLLMIRAVRDRLYSENKMSGDDMRDMADRLRIAMERVCEADDD